MPKLGEGLQRCVWVADRLPFPRSGQQFRSFSGALLHLGGVVVSVGWWWCQPGSGGVESAASRGSKSLVAIAPGVWLDDG